MRRLEWVRAFIVLSLAAGAAPRLTAQSDTLQSARALRASSRFADAISLLRPYLASHPESTDAARLLSETLYWVHDIAGARAVADSSLARSPRDTPLRLQYGAMLVDLGDAEHARAVLTPLLESAERGRALGLLGALAANQGDLTRARSLFIESLRASPDQPDVRRQLGAILEASAPWTGAGAAFSHDDQPINSLALRADAGWFATPLTRIAAHVDPTFFSLSDSATREVTSAEVSVSGYAPQARADVEFAAGGVQRSFGSTTDWRGRVALGLRLPAHVTVGVRGEHAPYLSTEASLSTPLMTNTGTAVVHLDTPRGWLAEGSLATQRFPDANSVNTAYAWILAPLVHNNQGDVRLGYSAAWQDATESRFVLVNAGQSGPVANPRFDFTGRYVPYYTPDDVLSHSVVAAASTRASRRVTLRVNGAYALHATENATAFRAGGGPPPDRANIVSTVSRRTFTPWNVDAGVEIASDNGLTLSSHGQVTRSAFYRASVVDVRVSYRFGVLARRNAAGY